MVNLDIFFGIVEQFLLILFFISELYVRFFFWFFKLDYEIIEFVSIRLVDRLSFKYGIEVLKKCEGNWIELLFIVY